MEYSFVDFFYLEDFTKMRDGSMLLLVSTKMEFILLEWQYMHLDLPLFIIFFDIIIILEYTFMISPESCQMY